MISKDLATEILGYKVTQEPQKYGNEISFHYMFTKDVEAHQYLNIYELANMCKEWALKQGNKGYIIHSNISHTFGKARVEWYEKNHYDQHNQYRELTFYSEWFEAENNNEPEAVFKACEWILINKKDNK